MILDAGVLVAVGRGASDAKNFAAAARRKRRPLRTTAPVVAQVWRDGARQALLARFLKSVEVLPFSAQQAPLVGEILRASDTSDVVDAHVLACAVERGESIITADSRDFSLLTAALGSGAPAIREWR